jgi:hypothetical protein
LSPSKYFGETGVSDGRVLDWSRIPKKKILNRHPIIDTGKVPFFGIGPGALLLSLRCWHRVPERR